MMDEMYHNCRWCKYYENGICYKGFASHDLGDAVYKVAENGDLSEVIEETLNSEFPKDLIEGIKDLLKSWKVSKKRIEEVDKYYKEKLPEILDFHLKESLDENISRVYQDRVENELCVKSGLEINDPENFYCKYFE